MGPGRLKWCFAVFREYGWWFLLVDFWYLNWRSLPSFLGFGGARYSLLWGIDGGYYCLPVGGPGYLVLGWYVV